MWDLSEVKMPGELPDGDYVARCDTAEVKETKSGTGQYVKCKFIIEETGDFVWFNFNIKNDNSKAQKIGLEQLKQFATFGGHETPSSIDGPMSLCGLRCGVHIKNKLDDFSGTIRPNITSFKKLA